MPTECSATEIDFGKVGRRRVVADFDGGMVLHEGVLPSRAAMALDDLCLLGAPAAGALLSQIYYRSETLA